MVRRPRQGFDCSLVLGELQLRGGRAQRVPDADDALVAAGGQLLAIGGPLQAADLLAVALQPHGARAVARVPVQDVAVPAAGGQRAAVPREGGDAPGVAPVRPEPLAGGDVVELHLAVVPPQRQLQAVRGPGHGGHLVARAELAEPGRPASAGAPQVDGAAHGHGEDVGGGAVQDVEVEVVLQGRGLQDLERLRRHLPRLQLRRRVVRTAAAQQRRGRPGEGVLVHGRLRAGPVPEEAPTRLRRSQQVVVVPVGGLGRRRPVNPEELAAQQAVVRAVLVGDAPHAASLAGVGP
mmetsp:Transcript_53629/g.141344  ORF Transcript_53629/g.141344 Transcript_53629/m.141344 type:complete len:293 (+) Transcript_53629:428-1306(+)